jgi:murein DD-endopeptidase MepM/ murein hydrolase activator NlpD
MLSVGYFVFLKVFHFQSEMSHMVVCQRRRYTMSKVQTPFSPLSEGFRFPNYFELKLPVKFKLPLAGTVDLNDVVFGLCGGMCFAALDYYITKKYPLPEYTSPKEIDSRLLVYLCERQIDSLQLPVLIKIIDWMASGNDVLAGRMLKNEIPRLRRMLDRKEPAVLCLIRTQGFANPTLNHQVLATGYEFDEDAGTISITLYDPNHPGEVPTITTRLNRKDFSIQQSTGETLRGFFLVPYRTQKAVPAPPEAGPAAVAFDLAATPEPPFRLKWPVDSQRINQRFGENPAMYRQFQLAGHEGLDFFAPSGAKIYAAFDGVVSEAKYRGA